ncbi:hypothetical protein [Ruminiclostridium cellobioparum]|uniref:hypothetical protein n=1 Tax=Ruminiclostridium cellobioparum TaxID=29355 RepID=UPI0028A8A6B7|nr:hypothetical protein [Ruminiclostridium cellobioparum]
MKLTNIVYLILFTILNTIIAIIYNIDIFFSQKNTTILNFIFSVTFFIFWFMFSLYMGTKKQNTYTKFIFVYWGINIISNILIWLFSLAKTNLVFLFPLYLWYCSPAYGFSYLLGTGTKLILLTSPLGLIFSGLGYLTGLRLLKSNS